MTVTTATRRVTYLGDGVTTAFTVPFRFDANGDLRLLSTSAAGVSTLLALNTNYSVVGAGLTSGGTVTLVTAPVAGSQLLIKRIVGRTQLVDYTPFDPFPAETQERALDKLTMMAQEDGDDLSRALLVPEVDPQIGAMTIPAAADRSARLLGFDAVGRPTVGPLISDLLAIIAASLSVGLQQLAQNVIFVAGFTGSVSRSVWARLNDRPSVLDYIPVAQHAAIRARTSTYDCSAGIQAAIAANNHVYFPEGTYDAPTGFQVRTLTTLQGAGPNTSVITSAANVAQMTCVNGTYNLTVRDLGFVDKVPVVDVAGPSFNGTTAAGNSLITGVSSTAGLYKGMKLAGPGIPAGSYIRYISGNTVRIGKQTLNFADTYVNATASGTSAFTTAFRQGRTVHNVYLNNAGRVVMDNIVVRGNYGDADYSPNNNAGIWFDRDTGGPYYINELVNSFIDHAHALVGTSDTNIVNSTVYGIGGDYGVKCSAPGISVKGCNVSSGQVAAIWSTATAKEPFGATNHAIVDNNIDGGGLWQSGYGYFSTLMTSALISGNKFNIIPKAGIYLETPTSVTIGDNLFFENNIDALAYSEVEINAVSFQPTAIAIGDNTFAQASDKTSGRGWAIREINSGFYPAGCAYTGNGIGALYNSPAFSIVTPVFSGQAPNVSGNSGGGMDAGITGTFTPILVGSTTPGAPTYSVQSGYYALSNGILNYKLDLTWSSLGTAAGNLAISALPASSRAGQRNGGSITNYGGFTFAAGRTQMMAQQDGGTAALRLVASGSAQTGADLLASAAPSGFISISGSYAV